MKSWRKALVVIAGAVLLAGCSQKSAPQSSQPRSGKSVNVVANAALLENIPARIAEDGVAIEVGSPSAPTTVTVYEDARCPYCSKFERANGAILRERVAAGGVKVRYVFASFLDERFGGGGSVRAANAMRAALEEGAFPSFHAVLLANQPHKSVDGYTVERLIELADTIPALKGNKKFADAIARPTYGDWIIASQKAYSTGQNDYPTGVPTVIVNGVNANDALYDAAEFSDFLSQAIPA